MIMSDETSTQSINNDNYLTINQSDHFDQTSEIICNEIIKERSSDQKPLSILSNNHQNVKVDEQFVLKISKESKNVSKEVKNSCKILHFSSEWSLEEVLTGIDGLNPQEYPNLFIFVIELTNFKFLRSTATKPKPAKNKQNDKVKKIKQIVRKFSSTRPMLLQFTSEEENVTKFRYKEEDSAELAAIDQENNFWDHKNFPSFLVDFLDGKFENFEDFEYKLYEILSQVHKSSLLLKFWTTLNLSEEILDSIVLEVSKRGTQKEFLAAIDAPFEDNIGMLRDRAEQYLPWEFPDDINKEELENNQSVLLRAVENQNKEVIDYLITFWTHLIQQLSFEHQVRVSKAAFDTNQLDVLCDLLEIADFPFPKDFKDDNIQNHEKLQKITNERLKLAKAIKTENYEDIKKFTDNNLSLRIAYNPVNKPAIQQAVDAKQYKVYFYLKSFGFIASQFDNLEDVLTADELKESIQYKIQQRRENVNEALTEDQKSVNLLCNRSFIHNRRVSKQQEVEYRKQIRKWFGDINKIKFGDLFLNVAASCENLKIIFDFENCSVENLSFQTSSTLGSMFPQSKWIFVGAKLTKTDGEIKNAREQQIKGVLAHELCHYVMKLVYENKENPYYKIMVKIAEMFEEIVKSIDKWSGEDAENPDDECNGTISSVFKYYNIKDFHPELIVRVVHILAEFDDNAEKSKYLQDKYKILFDFWENRVIPDLKSFNLRSREAIRKMNRMLELLEYLKSELYSFNEPKDIKTLFDNQLTIVTTNVPILLLNDVFNYLQERTGDLLETENIFVDPKVLENKEILQDFTNLLQENPNLNIFVNCSSEMPESLPNFEGTKTVFIVSNEDQHKNLLKILDNPKTIPTKMEVNYNWSDLKQESQELLLDHEVNFQNWTELSILQLLMTKKSYQEPTSSESYKKAKNQVLSEFSKIIDDQLLNLLVEGSDIFVNVQQATMDGQDNKSFNFLFIEREFIKKSQIKYEQQINLAETRTITFGLYVNREGQAILIPNISQDELLVEVKDKHVVLISDIAGNGKSWVMKNFADTFREDDLIKWVTYVDLKQFIDDFKAQECEPEFSTFMTKNILKIEQKFEGKIFQNLYKNGKVLILFDGFDEIAPDCAEFVSKLAENFQSNGGNQLWIATRDYFEVNLQQKLQTDAVYKIKELNLGEAISLIAQSWVLLENDKKFETIDEFDNYIKNPDEQYSSYLQKAHQIVQKLFSKFFNPVGMPHLLTMVAECYKNDKDGLDLNLSNIFEKFMDRQYEKWSYEKGQIRKAANIRSQKLNMSFWKLHQYYAIAILFPEFLKILFPRCDVSEWPIEEIIACGVMSKFGDKIFFVHETYGEFFVADLVANELKRSEVDEKIVDIFVKILTTQKFVIIRGFLNGLIDDSTLEKIQSKLDNFVYIFNKDSNQKFENFLIEIFINNLDKFINFTLKIIKCESYEKIREIIQKTTSTIAIKSNDPKYFLIFQDFIFDTLTADDFEDLIYKEGILQAIIRSDMEFEVFEKFIIKAEEKSNQNAIKKGLLIYGTFGSARGNIFHHLSQSSKFNLPTYRKLIKILLNFFNVYEICGLLMNCNEFMHSILNLYVVSPSYRALKELWRETENFYSSHGLSELFKELVKQGDSKGFTVLDYSAFHPDMKLHEDLWEVLIKTFDNREDLKNVIIKNNNINHANFINTLMLNTNPALIEFEFKKLKANFTKQQFTEIIKSKGELDMNILQTAAICSKFIEVHRLVWKNIRETCNSDAEFVDILKEVDTNGRNILQNCSYNSSKEVFEFIIEEIEKIAQINVIKRMLIRSDNNGCKILQCFALQNVSLQLHESVWKLMKKYFDASEIVNFIHHTDKKYGENIFFLAFTHNSLQITELAWNEIKKFLTYEDQVKYLMKIRNKSINNLLERASLKTKVESILKDKIEWLVSLFRDYNIEVD